MLQILRLFLLVGARFLLPFTLWFGFVLGVCGSQVLWLRGLCGAWVLFALVVTCCCRSDLFGCWCQLCVVYLCIAVCQMF